LSRIQKVVLQPKRQISRLLRGNPAVLTRTERENRFDFDETDRNRPRSRMRIGPATRELFRTGLKNQSRSAYKDNSGTLRASGFSRPREGAHEGRAHGDSDEVSREIKARRAAASVKGYQVSIPSGCPGVPKPEPAENG